MYKWHLREFHKYRAFRQSRLIIMLGSLPSKNANFMSVQFIHGFAPFARNFKYYQCHELFDFNIGMIVWCHLCAMEDILILHGALKMDLQEEYF